jgi:hypothetical protein
LFFAIDKIAQTYRTKKNAEQKLSGIHIYYAYVELG